MNTKMRLRERLALGTGALLLAGAVAVGAYAATGASRAGGAGLRGQIASAVTGELGISASQLRSDLAGGQTLAQIASANGSSASSLEQTVLGALKTRLDRAVANGKLTSTQEQNLLTNAGKTLDRLVNLTHPIARLARVRMRLALLRVAAHTLGLTPSSLRTQLGSGQTLAQIAAANGQTTSGLESAITTAVTSALDKAVANGKLSAAREQTMLSNLQARLDTLVNHDFAPASS